MICTPGTETGEKIVKLSKNDDGIWAFSVQLGRWYGMGFGVTPEGAVYNGLKALIRIVFRGGG